IDPRYLDQRAGERFAPAAPATPGDPGRALRDAPLVEHFGRDSTHELAGTTHLSVIDVYGNAVALTASVEAPFGSARWVGGFLLNNQLTDFARDPRAEGPPAANVPAPGKRPRSSMSPTLVFDANRRLVMATGSPGGSSIVAYVAKTVLGVLAWGQTAQEAIDFPNLVARGDRVGVETASERGAAFARKLRDFGYDVAERRGENSGLHVLVVRETGLEGGADPRREGEVRAVGPISQAAHASDR
ncbi:MAG: gamma-glutamyltransferase, partial [Proteobacteria bacterium]|nr:gamma-glutamyltransferase [Pseudomonadota bacterium]